ncbi:hypothetical protein Tco_1190654 [Tanacetum coccineum]
MSAKDSITTQTSELSQEEFNDFLTLFHVPSEYCVILPKSNQTVFDAPPGYVELYTHSFSLANLRLPLTEFFYEVLKYFQVHILRLNPFGCAKLTTFVVMCKAYGCEPSVDLFRGFFNLCRADSIIPAKYPQLFSEQNKLDLKSFIDKLPPNNEENPMFQCLSRYPTSVRVFPDPILFLAGLKPSWEHGQQRPAIMAGGKEMAFRNFIYTEDDEDLAFLPKEPSPNFGVGSPSISVNTEPLKANEEPEIQPVEVTADSGRSPKPELPPVKRKLASGSSTSRATRAKTSSSKDDAPFLKISDDDEGLPNVLELKDANACHLKISAITPPAWKNHLDNHIDLELRSHELLQVIEKLKGEFDVMRNMERVREEECEGLRVKCEAAMTEMMLESQKWAGYQHNLSTLESKVTFLEAKKARLEAVEVSLRKEVEELRQDENSVIADKKEPFNLSKVKGYRSSYKKDHTQASNDFCHQLLSMVWRVSKADPFWLQLKFLIVEEASILLKGMFFKNSNPLTYFLRRATPTSTGSISNCEHLMPTLKVGFYEEHSLPSYLRIWRTLSLTPLCALSSGGSCLALNL